MKYSKILLCFGALWASSAFPAPVPCDTLRVAFLTDIHVTPGNVQDSLFRVAVDEINASPCDIVIFGGDLTNLGSDAELEYVHGLISRLEKPWHAVPGNHETTWSESACTTFARIFGHDGRTAFRAGDYLFLGYASGPFMKMAMGAVRTEDLAWLAAEAAKARPGQRIVSLCHYPLNNDLTNRTEVTATLRRLGIPLTLFGHYHRAPSLFNFDSIAGIQGRALRGKSDSDAGYTLLDFWGDSVRVREKTLGAEPRTRFTIRMQDDRLRLDSRKFQRCRRSLRPRIQQGDFPEIALGSLRKGGLRHQDRQGSPGQARRHRADERHQEIPRRQRG